MHKVGVGYIVPLNTPVRFLALEWREHWEFDYPSVLLGPVFRYSPNGTDLESLIEDAAIDLAIAADEGAGLPSDISDAESKEFRWRHWTIDKLRLAAEAILRGEKPKVGVGYAAVREEWLVFEDAGRGEVEFRPDREPKEACNG